MPALSCVLLGTVTGVAGGAVRDIVTAQVPLVLQRGSLYASAAIAGTGLYVVLVRLGMESRAASFALDAACRTTGWAPAGLAAMPVLVAAARRPLVAVVREAAPVALRPVEIRNGRPRGPRIP